jgi:hypothetical protein
VVIIGSYARTYSQVDAYSDLGIIIATEDPESWLYGEEPAKLGNMKISFVEPTFTGSKTKDLTEKVRSFFVVYKPNPFVAIMLIMLIRNK